VKREKLPIGERLALTVEDAAKLLDISRSQAYEWVKDGTLPAIRVPNSNAVRIPRRALEAWIEERTTHGRAG
jgi:excisionase family DNA binding protein